MGPDEMREIGTLIAEAIERRDDASEQARLAGRVSAICARFPVPGLADELMPTGLPTA
jgi:glycine/serine hydroxymethyltransferase